MSDKWSPIGTAPKDGSRVLVTARLRGCSLYGADLVNDYGTWVVVAHWEEFYERWADGSQCSISPTHWMPLPEPAK